MSVSKVLETAEKVITASANLNKRTFIYKNNEEVYIHDEITYSGRIKTNIRKILGFCELSNIGKRATYGHRWYVVK